MRNVLIVEDDKEIRKLLNEYLSANEYKVTEAINGKQASDIIGSQTFDIILMDMMLPYKSGSELIEELRNRSDDINASRTPVIVISAKSGTETRIDAIRIGADDYIIKPFNLDEVLVRIEAVLRRVGSGEYTENEEQHLLNSGNLQYNVDDNTVSYNGQIIKLTAKEIKLLYMLMKNPTKTFTKANLYESVWEDEYIYEDNTINVHMSNLRSKLKKATGEDYIETVWGIGYKLKNAE